MRGLWAAQRRDRAVNAGHGPFQAEQMNNKNIAAPLASALAGRGYATLTSVQQAVLEPEARGRAQLPGKDPIRLAEGLNNMGTFGVG